MAKSKHTDPKRDELERRATLHPHPEQVVDPLFQGEPFFDARDAVQVKYEMLRRVQVDERPIARAAADFGFSRPSFYKAQAAFGRSGLPGLLPAKKGPRRAHKLSARVMELLEQELAVKPSLSSRELVERLRARFEIVVHPRSIERALARREKKRP
jgi:transposase